MCLLLSRRGVCVLCPCSSASPVCLFCLCMKAQLYSVLPCHPCRSCSLLPAPAPCFCFRHNSVQNLFCFAQGGLSLVRVLTLLKQATAALMHLHSLGILHRDLRAANVLIDSLDPLRVLVADLGVSHQLSAFASGDIYKGASKVTSVLTGAAALGPLQVGAVVEVTTPTLPCLLV
jgi:serine/threonine protein kinase